MVPILITWDIDLLTNEKCIRKGISVAKDQTLLLEKASRLTNQMVGQHIPDKVGLFIV